MPIALLKSSVARIVPAGIAFLAALVSLACFEMFRAVVAFFSGWLRAFAVDAGGATAIAVGDTGYFRFDLANLAAGPVANLVTETGFEHLVWSEGDDVALALGARGETESELAVLSTVEDRITPKFVLVTKGSGVFRVRVELAHAKRVPLRELQSI